MKTKFISLNGYEEIENLETSKKALKKFKKRNKKTLTVSSLLLTVMYFIFIVPAKAIKNFSLKEFINSLTPKKVMQNFLSLLQRWHSLFSPLVTGQITLTLVCPFSVTVKLLLLFPTQV